MAIWKKVSGNWQAPCGICGEAVKANGNIAARLIKNVGARCTTHRHN